MSFTIVFPWKYHFLYPCKLYILLQSGLQGNEMKKTQSCHSVFPLHAKTESCKSHSTYL